MHAQTGNLILWDDSPRHSPSYCSLFLCLQVTVMKPGSPPDVTFCEFGGIDYELKVLARQVEGASGKALRTESEQAELEEGEKLLSPFEAMDDLAVIAACLKSGANNGIPVPVDRSFMS